MSKNTTLNAFTPQTSSTDTQTSTSNQDPSPKTRNTDDYSLSNYSLPDKNTITWADELDHLHKSLIYVPSADTIKVDVSTKSLPIKFHQNQIGYVIDGASDLKLDSDRTKRIYPPSTYSEFTDFDQIHVKPTTTFSNSRFGGWGITADLLEGAIRLVTGGGNYRAANLTVTTLDLNRGWLIEYKGDTYLFSYTKVGQPSETVTTTEVNGIKIINEADQNVLDGIKVAMDILPTVGVEITGFDRRKNNSLYFTTNRDKPIKFTGKQLARLTSPTDPQKYKGTHTVEPFHTDESYEYTWSSEDTNHTPPEVTQDDKTYKKIVLGYTKSTNYISRGVRPNKYTVGQKILATPWHLRVSFDKYDDRIDTNVQRSNCSEIISKIPYDTPDHPDPDSLDTTRMWHPNA